MQIFIQLRFLGGNQENEHRSCSKVSSGEGTEAARSKKLILINRHQRIFFYMESFLSWPNLAELIFRSCIRSLKIFVTAN